jgi:hypothetical protein
METIAEEPKPKFSLNPKTRGHKRVIKRLGGPASAMFDPEAWEALSDEEKTEGTLVLIWLFQLPVEDLLPGQKIDTALKVEGGWQRYFHQWEFNVLDTDVPALVEELNRVLS